MASPCSSAAAALARCAAAVSGSQWGLPAASTLPAAQRCMIATSFGSAHMPGRQSQSALCAQVFAAKLDDITDVAVKRLNVGPGHPAPLQLS